MNNEPDYVQDGIDRWRLVSHRPSKEELARCVNQLLQEERARMVKVLEECVESLEQQTDEGGDVVAVAPMKLVFSDIIRRLTHR